jgi:hypothetical protein
MGGRWFYGHLVLHTSAPQRAACIGISQQWRAYLTDGHSVTPAQVNSTRVKKEALQNARLDGSALGTKPTLISTLGVFYADSPDRRFDVR